MDLNRINELTTRTGRLIEEMTARVYELPGNMADGISDPANARYDPDRLVTVQFGMNPHGSAPRMEKSVADALVLEINAALSSVRARIEADAMTAIRGS